MCSGLLRNPGGAWGISMGDQSLHLVLSRAGKVKIEFKGKEGKTWGP